MGDGSKQGMAKQNAVAVSKGGSLATLSRSNSRMGFGSVKKMSMSCFRGLLRKWFHRAKSAFI